MASLEDVRSLTQPLKVEVDFYDPTERQKLSRYGSFERIKTIIEQGLQIPAAEFLTYYLFHRKRPGKEGYRNYPELASKSYVALTDLEDWIDLRNGTAQFFFE